MPAQNVPVSTCGQTLRPASLWSTCIPPPLPPPTPPILPVPPSPQVCPPGPGQVCNYKEAYKKYAYKAHSCYGTACSGLIIKPLRRE